MKFASKFTCSLWQVMLLAIFSFGLATSTTAALVIAYDEQTQLSIGYDDASPLFFHYDSPSPPPANENANRTLGHGGIFAKPTEFLAAEAGTIDAASVRFTQSSIKGTFSEGGTLSDFAQGLRSGAIDPASIPPIRLVEREGQLFTLDNRRLWGFQQAELPVPYRMATPQEAAAEAWKFTTKNGGTSIRVRGQ